MLGERGKYYLLSFTFVLIMLFVATIRAEETHIVRVGIFENPPIVFSHVAKPPHGIAIDVLDYVAQQEKWRVEYVNATWGELLKLMDNGKLDVLVGMGYSEERARKYKINRESLLGNWGIVYRRSHDAIVSPLDLKNQRVALVRGSIHSDIFSQKLMEGFGVSFTPIYVDSYAEALEAVAQHHAEAGVVNRTFGALNAHKYDVVETGIIFNPIYIHYASPFSADPSYLRAIDKHLTVLKADPNSIYYQSIKHWMETPTPTFWSSWAIWLLGGVLALLALVIVVAILLRHQVQRKTGELRLKTEQLQDEIDRRRQAQDRLNRIAYFDGLTQLPNREGFREAFAQAIAQSQRQQTWLALLFIDLDRLKNINDGLGHDAGDLLLKKVAQRLQSTLRDRDHLSRFGGDEFIAIVQGSHAAHDAEQVAVRMLHSLDAPIEVGASQVHVTASIGIALYPDHAQDPDSLLKYADTAMYQAKEQGKNRYLLYQSHTQHWSEPLTSATRLRNALERDELCLYYQPIIDLHNRHIIGVEALLRWNDPERGLMSPAEFIPLAENTGLIAPIGEWVLKKSCAQLHRWQELGIHNMRMSVNVSTHQVNDHLLKIVDSVLHESCLLPAMLELDVIEDVTLTLNGKMHDTLFKLSERGVRLTIDDFGTGYSNLNYLGQLPLHTLKIDRSFIANISSAPKDRQIASTILMMGQSLGLQVLGEGIETAQQCEFLHERGCSLGQGNFFSPPRPADELLATLQSRSIQ